LPDRRRRSIAGAEAVLRSGAHHLRVTCAVPAKGVTWKFDDLSAPVNSWDAPNKDLKRLSFVVQAPKDGVVNLSVRLTPID